MAPTSEDEQTVKAQSALTGIFEKILADLDTLDEIREKMLPLQRQIVRNSSRMIKQIHQKNMANIGDQIAETKLLVQELETLGEADLPKDYVLHAKQEFGEAVIFYHIIAENRIPAPNEMEFTSSEYCYALADVVGELRRYCLACLMEDEYEQAKKFVQFMEEIYSHLQLLKYPSGLLPGLRKKRDIARRVIIDTQSEILMASKIAQLNSRLN